MVVKDDLVALRLIQWVNNQGISSERLFYYSINNSSFAEIMHPFLTTYDINIQELGRKCSN
ncbi:MAG: substrate-binding domain-containing protein [Streptococcus salivarius]